MDIIHLLSDNIANQIAAGEVVQRPASVVKELLENSIDAGAKNIQLIIKEAGKTLIQVIDDGIGMSLTDARMCFERHATSKISRSEDLFNIRTMGFRGEAMASIAAVAQVELKTRKENEELGTWVKIEGSDFKSQEPVSVAKGSNIQVKNLFFNVPARRNFLKSNPVEMKHILDEFQRVALAHPEISFEAFHNEIELYTLHANKLSRRIIDLFGKSYREQLADCNESTPYVNISGYVGKPESAKKTRGEQFFFVNNRFIKSSYLNHAVSSAFESTIPAGSHPFYVLNLEIEPKHIDINIHPTKTEIKFDDEKSVYAILRSAVRQAIGVYNLSPTIDFESDINFANLSSKRIEPQSGGFRQHDPIQNFEKNPSTKSNLEHWQDLYKDLPQRNNPALEQPRAIQMQSAANDLNPNNEITEEVEALQIHNRYLAVQVKSGMMLIDQKGAYERILYEQFLKQLGNKTSASQQLLFQKTLQLSPENAIQFVVIEDLMKSLGFGFDAFGKNTWLITGMPVELSEEDPEVVIPELIDQYRQNDLDLKLNKTENMARAMSKKSAHRWLKPLTKVEINNLINKLFESSMPGHTPDGRPITKIVSLIALGELIAGGSGFKS